MSKLVRLLMGIMVCALCLTGGTALAASGQHEVTANKLYFREKASAKSDLIASLSEGTVVTVLSTDDGWAKARWNGKVGYLSYEYLEKIDSASKAGRNTTKLSGTAWMKKDGVMYEAADSGSDEICELVKGTKLSLRGETLNFYYVKANGKTGYILKSRVTEDEVAKAASSSGKSSSGSSSSVLRKGSEGEDVLELQERLCELNYLDEKYVTGYFGNLTYDAVRYFQLRAGLEMDGVAGPATMKKLNSSSAPKKRDIIEMDWYDSNVSSLVYKRGGTAYIVDCETGIRIKIRRVGGSNHMDVEPASASDTEKLLKIYGGSWSWDQRAVILIADGKYIAASINGMPHGDEISESNDFEGQFCLHTTGSKTHGSDKVNGRHQDKIEEALNFL